MNKYISVRLVLGLTLLATLSASAQFIPSRIKSFGFVTQPGTSPQGALTQGSDGMLYGTASSGGFGYGGGTIFRVRTDGTGYETLHYFTGDEGWSPYCKPFEASDGALYGAASAGGTNGFGTIFKINKDGTGFSVLRSLSSADGTSPNPGDLVEGGDGALYGTANNGGTTGNGTIYKINKDGSGFAVLHTFTGGPSDGAQPVSGLIAGPGGALFGITYLGGSAFGGVLFRITTNGTGYAVLHSFSSTPGDQFSRAAGLLLATDGVLYGVAGPNGPSSSKGEVFKVNVNGSGYVILTNLSSTTSLNALVEGTNGMLYGTSVDGGAASSGTIFRINKNGTGYAVLHSFGTGGTDALGPQARLLRGSDGILYGTASSGGISGQGALFRLNHDGTGYSVFLSLISPPDGITPFAPVVEASDGSLFGTTISGGSAGQGIVYKLDKTGSNYSVLHNFTSTATDGGQSDGVLVEGFDGALYGTTTYGGSSNHGTIFKISKDGTGYSILHSFTGTSSDGSQPDAGLIQGRDGGLYGTTYFGGTGGSGTVFRISTNGSFAVLHSLINADGVQPGATVVQASDGKLYGNTSIGGTFGGGTIFSLNTNGAGFTVLLNFNQGENPEAPLIEGTDGVLYGTTYSGGAAGEGSIFKINKNGSGYTVLGSFGFSLAGAYPSGGLLELVDGRLYGTTANGGSANLGTVFRINKDGINFAILYNFTGTGGDGGTPDAALIMASDGQLYATAGSGGDKGNGAILKFTPPATLNNPRPAHLSTNIPATTGLSWDSALESPTPATTYDVYFGTNPTPGPAELQGTTTNTSWTLSALAPLTTYYWQIVSHKLGQTNGPVWQFTTRGVDHFQWTAVSSPQYTNQPFSVTIAAKDEFNTTVSNFTVGVALSGSIPGLRTNTILPSPASQGTISGGPYSLGYAFTLSSNITVTAVRHFFGSKVSIWTDGGTLLAAQSVTSVPGTWVETRLATPLQLQAGNSYRIAALSASGTEYFIFATSAAFSDGTATQSYFGLGDVFPTNFDSGLYLVDLKYTAAISRPIGISPTASANFTNGSWAGNMAVLQPATNLTLLATDLGGHTGQANAINVLAVAPVQITAQPQSQSAACHSNATYNVTATGTPPLSYQWRKNGSPVSGATTNTYLVTPLSCQAPDNYTVVVTNAAGAITSSVATLTVVDTNPPVIICPANMVVNTAAGQCSAVVTYPVTATDNCIVSSLIVSPPSGSVFPKGINAVTCTAIDCAGNSNVCSFTVTVVDREAPSLVCPTNRTVVCNTTNGAQAFFTATATDNCDTNVAVVCIPSSGSFFALGTNTVICIAADTSGNTNSCSFTITVQEVAPVLSISQAGNDLVLSWPQSCVSYVVEQRLDLDASSVWAPVSPSPTPVGDKFVITVTPGADSQFFRLRKN